MPYFACIFCPPAPKLHYGKTSLGKCSHQRARNQNKILIFCRLPYFCLLAYMKKTILDTPSQCQYNDENKCSDWSVGSVTLRPFPSNQPSDGHEGGYTSKNISTLIVQFPTGCSEIIAKQLYTYKILLNAKVSMKAIYRAIILEHTVVYFYWLR